MSHAAGYPYRSPPVVEAVIDIRVDWGGTAPRAKQTEFAKRLLGRFPHQQQLHAVEFQLSPEQASAKSSPHEAGWKLFNEKRDRVVLLYELGFLYSHLPPYTRWEPFSAEAESVWHEFVEHCSPVRVTRLATRYINRVRVPLGLISLRDYVSLFPESPEGLGAMRGFMIQVRVDDEASGLPPIHGNVTLVSEAAAPDHNPFVLDIDVFSDVNLPVDDPSVWGLLNRIRDRKNFIFESVITDRLRETFK